MNPSRMPMIVRAAALTICVAGGIAAAGAGGGMVDCFEQMWGGAKQREDLGGTRCKAYENCPTALRCYAGRVNLRFARTETMSVLCTRFKGGTWDPVKRKCVGGELQTTGAGETGLIPVEVCLDGCN